MKRRWIMLMLAMALVCAAAARGDAVPQLSIRDVRRGAPACWAGEYTEYGRQVRFCAPVYVPDVDEIPVLSVTCASAADATPPSDTLMALSAPNFLYVSRKATLDRAYWWASDVYMLWSRAGAQAAASCRAENADATLAQAAADMQPIADALWGEGTYGVLVERAKVLEPIRVNGQYQGLSHLAGWAGYAGKGAYHLYAYLTLHGVPVFMGAGYGVRAPEGAQYAALSGPALFGVGHALGEGEYADASGRWLFRETGVAVRDVPLCAFEDVRREVEQLIQVGRIREVFSLRLGYVVYQKRGETYDAQNGSHEMAAAEYIAVPTWVVECICAQSAGMELANVSRDGEEIPYNERAGFVNLMINAQTGKALDPYEAQGSRAQYDQALVAPEIALW